MFLTSSLVICNSPVHDGKALLFHCIMIPGQRCLFDVLLIGNAATLKIYHFDTSCQKERTIVDNYESNYLNT